MAKPVLLKYILENLKYLKLSVAWKAIMERFLLMDKLEVERHIRCADRKHGNKGA